LNKRTITILVIFNTFHVLRNKSAEEIKKKQKFYNIKIRIERRKEKQIRIQTATRRKNKRGKEERNK